MSTPQPTSAEAQARSFDMFSVPPTCFDDPHHWLRMLREYDPIHANGDGTALLTRYGDVRKSS
ncbi:hypothetical protein [Streptomyces sp. T028]|uniref:hypothetical protein n=1 Tax=Streptomyces sp. T028 TaxID=3394379 RepID=UPI003A885C88